MSNAATKKMIGAYLKRAPVTLFLSGFFATPPENFHNSEEVEVDIQRESEDVAIVITDLTTGARQNFLDLYSNKKFKPPLFDEEFTISAFDLIKREPGSNPFEDVNFAANLMRRFMSGMRVVDSKVRRAIELMASQVLQTGAVTLRDKSGTALYQLSFSPKSTHFPTVSTSWGAAGANPLADLSSLAEVIRTNGQVDPDILVFGRAALSNFLADAEVQKRLDNRGYAVGEVRPEMRGQGATFQGFIWIGNYRFQMWSYSGRYKDPQTGNTLPYVADDKVVMLSTQSRLDLTYGGIPRIVTPDTRLLPFVPQRFGSASEGLDLSTFAWVTQDGKQVKGSAGTRPLTIPTGIDTFGALDTTV